MARLQTPLTVAMLYLVPVAAFLPPLTSRLCALSAARGSTTAVKNSGSEAEWVLRTKQVPKKEEWVPLLRATDIAPGDLIPVSVDGLELLLVADPNDGSVYCTASNSPFMSAPLADGTVKDGKIICPQSRSAFDLETGELVGPWCPFPPVLGPLVIGKIYPAQNLATFVTRSRNGNIEALVDRNLKARFESRYWAGLLDAQGKATGDYY